MTEETHYIVECLFEDRIRYFREAELCAASRAVVVRDLLAGQFDHPTRVIAFNPSEGWSRDASAEIAAELARHAWCHEALASGLPEFCIRHGSKLPEAA